MILDQWLPHKKERFILTIGDEGGILVHMKGTKVINRLYAHSPSNENTQHMRLALKKAPHAPIYLLIDAIDQTFVQQTLPPVSALALPKLVARRLQRDFMADDITGAIPYGKQEKDEGRKDWHYLFIAVPNTPPVSDWIKFALQLDNRLKGLYLVPVEAERFLKLLHPNDQAKPSLSLDGLLRKKPTTNIDPDAPLADDAPPRWRLLVSHNKVSGFRQIIFKDGRLVLSRVAQPIGEPTPEVIAGNIEQEIANTTEYLKRVSFTPKQGLDVSVIVAQEIKDYLKIDNNNVRHTIVKTPHEVAKELGLEGSTQKADHFGDVVLAAAFAKGGTPKLRLQTPSTQELNKLYDIQTGVISAAALASAYFLFSTISHGWSILETSRDLDFSQNQKLKLERQLATANKASNSLPEDIQKVNDVLNLHHYLSRSDQKPLSLIARFADMIDETTLISKLDWRTSTPLPTEEKDDKIKTKVIASFGLEFLQNKGSIEEFLQRTDSFFRRLKDIFSEMEIDYSKLPGTIDQDALIEVDFSENRETNDILLPSRDINVEVTLTGEYAPTPKDTGVKP